MADALLLAVPLGALVYLVGVGSGAAVWLSPRADPDAQAALSLVVGAALVAVASAFVPLGVPARPLALAITGAGLAITLLLGRSVLQILRAGLVPFAIAGCAVVIAGVPALTRGSWQATSLYGSTDPYHWSSQARQYGDGPVRAPISRHPDRLTYERTKNQHWAFALSFGVLELAWFTGADPPDVYGALAAIVFALLPLAAFVCARVCFGWRVEWAAAASLLLAADASLLYASHFSWQQQLAGTAFVFAAATALRLGLERAAALREVLLAAFFAAAALASYRLGFAPYFLGLLAWVTLVYAWVRRASIAGVVRRSAVFVLAFGAMAAPSVAAVLLGFGDFFSSGGFSTTAKRAFPDGQIAEALGLVPRIWAWQEDWSDLAVVWLVAGSIVAAVLLVAAFRALRSVHVPRVDFLVAGVVVTLGGYLVLLLPNFAPYLSWKVLAYGTPFLALFVVAPAALGRVPAPAAAVAGLALLVAPSTAVATSVAIDRSRTPGDVVALEDAKLPGNAVVAVALEDPWEQAWATYYLRDHPLSIDHPSFVLTGEGRRRNPAIFRHQPVDYTLSHSSRGLIVWQRGGIVLISERDRSPNRSRSALSLP